MDDEAKTLIEDCFLRPLVDARTTNTSADPVPSKLPLKTELQLLILSDGSQKLVMNTLKSINGHDFQLNDVSKYKDKGGHMKKSFWKESGALIVHSVTDFSNPNTALTPEDRLRQFAIMKLEGYGFATLHCNEALDFCENNINEALELLFSKYMDVKEVNNDVIDVSPDEIQEMRNDEKLALESIYDKSFEVKDHNLVWSLKFKIEHLLTHSPSENKKLQLMAKLNEKPKEKPKIMCRNFVKGKCKYGNKCRFSHVYEDSKIEPPKNAFDDYEEKWFFLEIRFNKNTKYPYQAPFTFLKSTWYDIPRDILLKISKRLYKEACLLAADGMPSIYTISELLQMNETVSQWICEDCGPFLDPEVSLFYVPTAADNANEISQIQNPTHYEKGSTGQSVIDLNPEHISRENKKLLKRFLEKQALPSYQKMLSCRKNLPAWSMMVEILDLLDKSHVVVISGETGCGKSTQVPQFILDRWLFTANNSMDKTIPNVNIICTQPRRLSAIGVAERVSDERNDRVGNIVGYQIRLENKISSSTRLTFCTTGILLRRLQSDAMLENVSHIIVDEVHERSEESDFILLILKSILKKRKDLKVILMSATLNAKLFSDYFNGAPVLDIPGRTFPVEQIFLEDILEQCHFVIEMDSQYSRKIAKKDKEELMNELEYSDIQATKDPPSKSIKDENLSLSAIFSRYIGYSRTTCKSIYLMEPMKINPELIESVLQFIIEGNHEWPREGSILVFLPGLQEIQTVYETLMSSSLFAPRSGKFVLVPLHSTLTNEEQSLVFRKAPEGKRKIVLSTNIAETSVTIDDCVFVIDCGLMKEKRFDANRNMESLDLVWESRANALQRKGRAGRVMPGVCIHLFTEHRFKHNFISQPVPEIHRVPLEQLLLRIKTLHNFKDSNVIEVLGKTLEPPTEDNIISAVNRLQDVGAFDENQSLTALGHHLSALPVDVRIGKLMLFGAIFQCLDSVLTIAACLSHKSPFVCPFNKRFEAQQKKKEFSICNSDQLTFLLAYKKWLDVYKRNRYEASNFAEANFLSCKTLETISEMKFQFLELLVSIGFVPINIPKKRKNAVDNILELTGHDMNVNGDNNRLLVGLLCAALYPNIIKIMTPPKLYTMTAAGTMPKTIQSGELRFKTRENNYVSIHPSSVNSTVSTFLFPFLVFQEKIKTSKVFIRETSMVPLLPLIFFTGSDLRIELHDGDFLILIENGWIILKAHTHETAEMILCLRSELIKLLEEKIRDPCLNLLNHENGKKIIQTIIYLITKN